jgi:hypothetical protein
VGYTRQGMRWLRLALLSQLLPIDTSREEIKDNLKKSQLGSRVLFLSKCPDESASNRKAATELVQKWLRQGFASMGPVGHPTDI